MELPPEAGRGPTPTRPGPPPTTPTNPRTSASAGTVRGRRGSAPSSAAPTPPSPAAPGAHPVGSNPAGPNASGYPMMATNPGQKSPGMAMYGTANGVLTYPAPGGPKGDKAFGMPPHMTPLMAPPWAGVPGAGPCPVPNGAPVQNGKVA
jgi:hypothetical protein